MREIQIFVIGGNMKTRDPVFSNRLQRPLPNVHPAVVRTAGALMT